MSKFKPYQVVYVMDLDVSGSIINPNGLFIREQLSGVNKGCSLVQVCGVRVFIQNEKILSIEEFQEEMKKRQEK